MLVYKQHLLAVLVYKKHLLAMLVYKQYLLAMLVYKQHLLAMLVYKEHLIAMLVYTWHLLAALVLHTAFFPPLIENKIKTFVPDLMKTMSMLQTRRRTPGLFRQCKRIRKTQEWTARNLVTYSINIWHKIRIRAAIFQSVSFRLSVPQWSKFR